MKRFFLILFLFLLGLVNLAILLEVPSPIGTVVVRLKSDEGIGNQLFKFSAGYALAKETNSKLYIVVKRLKGEENYKNPLDGNIPIAKFRVDQKIFHYKDRFNKAFIAKEFVKENNFFEFASKPNYKVLIIDNDFESDIFFRKYKDDILSILTPKDKFENLQNIFDEITKENSVCVHVRRGDMHQVLTHYLIDIAYQENAVEKAKELIDNPRFFVFSDSIELAKKEMAGIKNLTFLHFSSFEDFVLMSRCANNIIANNTYSWWAAYLNDTEDRFIIAPNPRYSSKYFAKVEEGDYKKRKQQLYKEHAYPSDWIKVNYEREEKIW